VWAYRYKIDRDYLDRAVTGIHQGPRKLLDVTASSLRERAQDLRHRVSGRLSTEHILIESKRGQLRTIPITLIQKHIERLTAKGQNLCTQVKFALSGSTATIAGLKSRFDRSRFIKRLQIEHDATNKSRQQLLTRFNAVLTLRTMQHGNRRERFMIEKIKQRIAIERKSLNDKMATLRAIDPQNALQRGFALVYRKDGSLIKSISDISEKDVIYTQVADGSLTSEVTAKERKRD
jgi:exodeoxyribonuclease VII large subunit